MREQLEGSRAIATAVARCRPQVVPAYPITPQTHIVEALGTAIRAGTLTGCEFLTVESEFAAMSAAIGASAAGARAYTATASQGLLYMTEALFNAAGLGLPIVLTVANRAIGAPINIWNDQSDSMSQRDCGWVQLYAADNQEAVTLHVIAFRLAETLSVPVMVCVDGFVLTHAVEPIELPSQDVVDNFLPVFEPRQLLDPDEPVTIGAMVGPEAFTEVRYLAHHQLRRAEQLLADLGAEYAALTGFGAEPVSPYRTEGARTVIVTVGSVTGTVQEVVDELDERVGVVALTMVRPLPVATLRTALAGVDHVVVLERAFSPGSDGIVATEIAAALRDSPAQVHSVIAGLGGRAVTRESVRTALALAPSHPLHEPLFLDLQDDLVARELAYQDSARRSGPPASNLLRQVGAPGSRVG
jgi:pyruvate ferredoxin oxidoreductase alpha subunit